MGNPFDQSPSLSDVQQFNEIFREYRLRYVMFAKSYVKDEFAAEDIVMDALMSYWEKRSELTGISNLYAYILTIVKNMSLNYLEHRQTVMQVQEQIGLHELRELNFRISTLRACEPEELFSTEIMAILEKTLQNLPEQTRRIFTLSRIENRSHREIACMTGISTKAVEFHITKVLKALRVNLKDYMPLLLLYLAPP
ncbi:MAG: RNA polymerase sigma-70 factor [Bacteroidales bacterium]|jgi:RNA polymerase sigma-70 factor (ECF subfamily)|nr:RNA polymerase sigma-70 factor [Bacteroidales bacterium]